MLRNSQPLFAACSEPLKCLCLRFQKDQVGFLRLLLFLSVPEKKCLLNAKPCYCWASFDMGIQTNYFPISLLFSS